MKPKTNAQMEARCAELARIADKLDAEVSRGLNRLQAAHQEIALLLSVLRQSSDALRFAHPQLDPNSTIFQEVSSKVTCALSAIEAATQPKNRD